MTGGLLPGSMQMRAIDWLARSHPDPDGVRRLWEHGARALLPTGVRWDAVKVPASLLRRLAGSDVPEQLRAVLAEVGTPGPVVVDPGRSFYLLVPPGTADGWDVSGAECLGTACHLSVPAPSRSVGPGAHWLIPPDGTGEDLCDAGAVRRLLDAALGPRRAR